ncbi:MAG TPA: hypothetical protein VE291_02720 [Terracidiphilus sp.]|jgi:hypothetical protein|nr:hypothetical protein [Terracidiphilus sp.]
MRGLVSLAASVLLLLAAVPACASSLDDKIPDQQSIDALQARIRNAQPRELSFLYAQLMHEMTEFSLRQYSAGNIEQADGLLRQVEQITHKIHLSVDGDDKRLKNAEILLRHTAFRLNEMLHSSSSDDSQLVAETLAQVNRLDTEAMLSVFKK